MFPLVIRCVTLVIKLARLACVAPDSLSRLTGVCMVVSATPMIWF